ncbi:hypothetical protein HYPSUDRAFT_150581 [Hypholoma sublateritium FD-334 SS-4]|uniref:Probable RNA polymerase II nuclear localization protein SLC7A6OS n=1 Tax=Hypholoma sublateritium (strain FD-334 SS-4) TaxID=945553 RepID=A0A0D2NCK7_HYPSF|nr:hypothetical protein HYPSUDRAFT_150581 [Hypholoma sublateritium FD-334 SS-4]
MTPSSEPSYTILRIKRKRFEEPLDALVVEPESRERRSKKSRGGVGVFQYAQTVEDSDWNSAARQKAIQDEISRLARETAAKVASEAKASVPPTPVAPTPQSPARAGKDEPPATPAAARRYKIVDLETQAPKVPARRYPTAPPTVYSSKELEARKNARDFKMYDAVPSSAPTPMAVDEPSDMDNFLPMLNDYLSMHDSEPTSRIPLQKSSAATTSLKSKIPSPVCDEDDYVWDVFYHRPATLSEWNAVANNVGTVTGLPPSFGDTYDSASDSEEEFDEADEDSNAEDFYKNDYPDEEESGSGAYEWHEDSDYDDIMEYRNEQEQFDWR